MFVVECAFAGCSERWMPHLDEQSDPALMWIELADGRMLCPEHSASAPDDVTLHPQQREFGFGAPEDGAADRYAARRETRPWLAHTAWWLVHNCVAHPLIGVFPRRPAFRFHDWTSRKMHGRE
jgi:hypothetical protein